MKELNLRDRAVCLKWVFPVNMQEFFDLDLEFAVPHGPDRKAGLDSGLDSGLDFGLDSGLDFGLTFIDLK